MKKIIKINVLIALLISCIFSSCLKSGLKDLPAFTDAKIERWDFEYRWDNNGIFAVATFTTATPVISNDTMYVTTTVPNASASFPATQRDLVTTKNIVGKCNISTAATIAMVGAAPKLGVPGDFSIPAAYEVTAADGVTKKTWTLVLTLRK